MKKYKFEHKCRCGKWLYGKSRERGCCTECACPHDKIQIKRLGDGWEWSCHLCGDVTAVWDDRAFKRVVGDDYREVEVGESFVFNVVEKEVVGEKLQDV